MSDPQSLTSTQLDTLLRPLDTRFSLFDVTTRLEIGGHISWQDAEIARLEAELRAAVKVVESAKVLEQMTSYGDEKRSHTSEYWDKVRDALAAYDDATKEAT